VAVIRCPINGSGAPECCRLSFGARDLRLPLKQVNVITGPNGSGKSNLYQCLVLAAKAAQGQFAKAAAEEG
jgi:predicted ATPase